MRVDLLQRYAAKFFPSTKYLTYACRVEQYTLTKAANLVLNVDGCIGSLFLDLLNSSSVFTQVSGASWLTAIQGLTFAFLVDHRTCKALLMWGRCHQRRTIADF